MENQQNHLFPDIQSQKQRIRRLQFILLITAVIRSCLRVQGVSLAPLPINQKVL